jgi:lysophospholipase L1-like esterase
MTTLSRTRRLTTLASASILVASAAVFGAFPAHAAPGGTSGPPTADKVAYASLGDSYAAGVGGGEYLNDCLLSPNGYAAQLASDPGQVHVALNGCVGATVDDVASQLSGIDQRTRFVTLTVGANDLGLATVTAICLAGTAEDCAAAIAAAQANLPVMGSDLALALATIRAQAPKATVVVTGYPLLLDPFVFPEAAAIVNTGVVALNQVIEGVVTAAGPGFQYVDVTDDFASHGIGSSDPWIIAPPALEAFHPNPAGYVAYADAIRAVR